MDEEDSGKLKRIPNNPANTVGQINPVTYLALPDSHAEQLTERSALQRESAVELPLMIAHTMLILRSQSGKELQRLFLVSHVHERNLRSRRGDFRSFVLNIQNRSRAIGSTKVAQEDQEQRTFVAQRGHRDAVLGCELRESFAYRESGLWLAHRKNLVCDFDSAQNQ